MTDPVNSMSLNAWKESTDPIDEFGIWKIRNGRYWKYNPVSNSFVTASEAEKSALDILRAGGETPPGPAAPAAWDKMKWGD